MDTKNFEEEIDVLNLAKHILSKWKSLLAAGLCFAALGFGYKFYKTEFSNIPLEEVDKLFEIERVNDKGVIEKFKVNYKLYVEDYNAKLSKYNSEFKKQEERKREIERDITKIKESLNNSEIYNRESILFNMDPSSFSKISKTIIIYDNLNNLEYETDGTRSEETGPADEQKTISENRNPNISASKIEKRDTSAYINNLASYMRSSVLSDKVRTLLNKKKDKIDSYITELYGFEVSKNSITYYAQSDSDKLTKSILLLIENELKEKLSKILLPGVTFRIIDNDDFNGYSNELYEMQIDKKDSFEALKFQLADITSQLSSFVTPIKPEILIKNPNGPESLENYKLKKYIIFAIAGFMFGLFVLSGIYTIFYLFPGRIRDKSLFVKSLGIRTLAVFSSEKDELALKTLSEQLDVHAKGIKNIVIISTLDDVTLQRYSETLMSSAKNKGIDFNVANLGQISNIANSDAIIFLEKIDISRVTQVLEKLEIVNDLKKVILGFVYFV